MNYVLFHNWNSPFYRFELLRYRCIHIPYKCVSILSPDRRWFLIIVTYSAQSFWNRLDGNNCTVHKTIYLFRYCRLGGTAERPTGHTNLPDPRFVTTHHSGLITCNENRFVGFIIWSVSNVPCTLWLYISIVSMRVRGVKTRTRIFSAKRQRFL